MKSGELFISPAFIVWGAGPASSLVPLEYWIKRFLEELPRSVICAMTGPRVRGVRRPAQRVRYSLQQRKRLKTSW